MMILNAMGNYIFAIKFTSDDHVPQNKVNDKELIKKITIKVSIQ